MNAWCRQLGKKNVCLVNTRPTVQKDCRGIFISINREFTSYSSSGCWPSWAFQAHSVIFISVNTAVKEDSSGEQA